MTASQFFDFLDQSTDGDFPKVAIVQGPLKPWPFGRNSKTADFRQTFHYVLIGGSTTTQPLNVQPINQLTITTLAALTKAGDTLGLDGLVKGWEVSDAPFDPYADPTRLKGSTKRWGSYLPIDVYFYMPWPTFAALGV
jgi:hypothetical protein